MRWWQNVGLFLSALITPVFIPAQLNYWSNARLIREHIWGKSKSKPTNSWHILSTPERQESKRARMEGQKSVKVRAGRRSGGADSETQASLGAKSTSIWASVSSTFWPIREDNQHCWGIWWMTKEAIPSRCVHGFVRTVYNSKTFFFFFLTVEKIANKFLNNQKKILYAFLHHAWQCFNHSEQSGLQPCLQICLGVMSPNWQFSIGPVDRSLSRWPPNWINGRWFLIAVYISRKPTAAFLNTSLSPCHWV